MIDPSMLMPLLTNTGGKNNLGSIMPLLGGVMNATEGNNNDAFMKIIGEMNPKLKPIMSMLPKMMGAQPKATVAEVSQPAEQYELQYNRPFESKKGN